MAISKPAREVNPSITLIVKYPRWYDRFYLFGYDTATLPRLFDRAHTRVLAGARELVLFNFSDILIAMVGYDGQE